MVVKTYRGLLADGDQDKIPLSTRDGSVGYRIVKFQLLPGVPGVSDYEDVVKVYREEQTSITGTINFTEKDLLAAAYLEGAATSNSSDWLNVIFDKEIFNQDIYITHKDLDGGQPCNYYLELEQMKLDHTQNMSATLKAIRGSAED